MRYRNLGPAGPEVSILGFGASPLGEEFGKIDVAEGERTVHAAIDGGVNFFDTAPFYGRTLSEERLGAALRGRREKVFIATKCCRYGQDEFDFSAQRVRESIDESLRRLQTDYVDVYQIHDIEFGDIRQVIDEAIPAAREVQRAGKARWIGITGLQLEPLKQAAAAAPVDTILSYARYNLAYRDLDTRLRPFAEAEGIGLINASPLLLGALTEAGPPPWHPGPAGLLEATQRAAELSREAGVDIATVALRHCLDYEPAATTLVGMSTREQLTANLAALDHRTPTDLASRLDELLRSLGERIWPSGRAENQDFPQP